MGHYSQPAALPKAVPNVKGYHDMSSSEENKLLKDIRQYCQKKPIGIHCRKHWNTPKY
jgi:hypothetical protein